jgi:hypothetical protein
MNWFLSRAFFLFFLLAKAGRNALFFLIAFARLGGKADLMQNLAFVNHFHRAAAK